MKWFDSKTIRCRIADMRGRGIYSEYADEFHCIFIHIPKAAGTSVAKTLFGQGSRHVRYTEYEKANPKKFQSYFKFSFVRNPWDRLYSAYSFMKKGGMNEMDRCWAEANIVDYPDFDSFVKGWVSRENIGTWVHFYPQYYFICDDQMNLKVDFVGRLENLDNDFSFVQQRLGMPVKPLPRINASDTKNTYIQQYSEETRKIVADVYSEDIKMFSYSFDNC